MTWFNESDHPDITQENPSLIIAAANLLQRYEYDLPPRVVGNMMDIADKPLDFFSVERAFEEFKVESYAESETWPDTNLAIVRQRRIDQKAAGVVDHYSLVADQRAHSIIDSLDGRIKSASEYGPILSWASYTFQKDAETTQELADEPQEGIHVLQAGENIWDVGRRYNIPVAALIAENDIEDPRHIAAGTELYLPQRLLGKKDEKAIRYELLVPAQEMHVTRETGAKKWSFGGVREWKDLYSTGRLYPYGHNLTIVAVAHVPIGEDTAAYYMDAVSLGEYETTGTPRYTNGFNWQHLAEGHIEADTPLPAPEINVEQVVADAMQEDTRPEVVAASPVPELPITPAPLSYKRTFQFLNEERTAVVYLFKEDLTIIEIDGKLPAKNVGKYDGVKIIGTFEYNGILYGRPALQHYWYGVPMDMLILEDELYNTEVDLPTRVALRGQLSSSEQRLVRIAKAVAGYKRMTSLFTRNK